MWRSDARRAAVLAALFTVAAACVGEPGEPGEQKIPEVMTVAVATAIVPSPEPSAPPGVDLAAAARDGGADEAGGGAEEVAGEQAREDSDGWRLMFASRWDTPWGEAWRTIPLPQPEPGEDGPIGYRTIEPPHPAWPDRPFLLLEGSPASEPWMLDAAAAVIDRYHEWLAVLAGALAWNDAIPLGALLAPGSEADAGWQAYFAGGPDALETPPRNSEVALLDFAGSSVRLFAFSDRPLTIVRALHPDIAPSIVREPPSLPVYDFQEWSLGPDGWRLSAYVPADSAAAAWGMTGERVAEGLGHGSAVPAYRLYVDAGYSPIGGGGS